jgi:TPR repeat protein
MGPCPNVGTDPAAQTNLGVMYDSGQGVPQDFVKASQMFQRGAAQGNAIAQCNLASMYFHGVGVEQNFEQALTLYTLSAEQGNQVALAKVNAIIEAIDGGR